MDVSNRNTLGKISLASPPTGLLLEGRRKLRKPMWTHGEPAKLYIKDNPNSGSTLKQ